jgi:uncharacterized protein YsxB (DUF464 family)
MIDVKLYRTREGKIREFRIEGHAGMAEKGQDIVCAAVSILTQAAVLGLNRHLGIEPTVHRQDGYLTCRLAEREIIQMESVQAILETMAIGLQEIAEQFPNYVRIDEHRR